MAINPKIIQKINSLEIPLKAKQIIENILEAEEVHEAMDTQKQIIKTYDRLLDRYAKDDELNKFCDEYGSTNKN